MGFIIAGTYLALLLMALLWNGTTALGRIVRVRRATRQSSSETAPCDPRAVFTLVHGTWARTARWTQPDSELCRAVAAVSAPVRFERFVWSGHNSVAARQRGVRQLIQQLRRAFVQWPNAQHYVIAHSHGGNIALQAMIDEVVAHRVAGVICLSTPFLTITPRQLGSVGRMVLWWVPVVVVFYGGVGLLQILMPTMNDTVPGVMLVAAIASGFAVARAVNRASNWLVDALRFPLVDASKILIIRAPADEASAALSAAHLISWVAGILWSGTTRIVEDTAATVERWREWLLRYRWWATTVCVTCVAIVIYWIAADTPSTGLPAAPPVFFFVVLLPLVIIATVTRGGWVTLILGRLLLAIIVTPMVAAIALVGMAIGPELLIAGLLFHVTAEAVPPGLWTVYQADVADDGDNSDERHASGLMHSWSYQHTAALQVLSRFIQERSSASAGL